MCWLFLQNDVEKGPAKTVYGRGVKPPGIDHRAVDKSKIRPVYQGVTVNHKYTLHFTHSANDVGVSYKRTL